MRLLLLSVLAFPALLRAQEVATPRPADVETLDGIIAAVYDVISGPAGAARDWARMRSLFHQGARFIPTGRSPDGRRAGARVQTLEQYIETNGPWFEQEGFFETELARETLRYGQIAHVFSTYEARHERGGPIAARGVNSLQLLFDGSRWWVLTILWNPEVPGEPLPGTPGAGQH